MPVLEVREAGLVKVVDQDARVIAEMPASTAEWGRRASKEHKAIVGHQEHQEQLDREDRKEGSSSSVLQDRDREADKATLVTSVYLD